MVSRGRRELTYPPRIKTSYPFQSSHNLYIQQEAPSALLVPKALGIKNYLHGDDHHATTTTNIAFHYILLTSMLASLLTVLTYKLRTGYHAFLALGPGGTPSTFPGYLRICVLHIVALRNTLKPPRVPARLQPQTGLLAQGHDPSNKLPKRPGPRPKVAGLAPHRQMTQRTSAAMYSALAAEIKRIATANSDVLYEATSCFEKHSTGLFTNSALLIKQPTCNGEVCHSHSIDGSMHLTLHPADVKMVLERGWGERHPLAIEDGWWKGRFVPAGFVMIYAPRNMEELECVVRIIQAASWWVNGIEPRLETSTSASSQSKAETV